MTIVQPWHYQDGELALVGELYPPTAPANGRAVLVVHEADGIGGNVRRHCARLAAQGYFAAAGDMHGGGRTLGDDEIPEALERFRSNPNYIRARVRAGWEALLRETGLAPVQTAAIGFCFGGYAVLELARDGAELAAVASFHGLLTTARPAVAGQLPARILVSTGDRDPLVPPADVAAFEAEMRAAEADWTLIAHGNALHSFTNVDVDRLGDPRMAYDAAAANLAWAALLAHLDGAFG